MTSKAKVLIVDDEYEKVKVLTQLIPADIAEIVHVSTSRDALNKIKDCLYDLLIIDLQIPEVAGEDVSPSGGKNLLEYIDDNDDLKKPTHILGLTVHPESYYESLSSFQKRGWTLICGIDDTDKLQSIINAKIRHAVSPPVRYDVAILTALEHVEQSSILELPCNWIPVREINDCNIYYSGTIKNESGREITLITTSCHFMGIASASAVAMKLCSKFSPNYLIMTGIAAGINGKVNLGDILIADPCWDWGNGKQTIQNGKPIFLSAPRQMPLDISLRAKFLKISAHRKYLDQIYDSWTLPKRPENELNIHVGPVATGAVVLEDPSIVEMIQSQHRETIGIEMEAYGVAVAANLSSATPPKTIIIKSVCDFADPNKNNDYQPYAAFTSAQLAFKFIENELSFG